MRWRHPSRAALRRWLAGGADERTEQHVPTCDRCAGRLEAMAGTATPGAAPGAVAPAADRSPQLRAALEAVLAAPPELNVRLTAQVHEQQQRIRLQDVVVDAVGGGFDTLRLLIGEQEDTGDG